MKKPDIDIGACTLCMGCVESCPEVFRHNDAGYIEIIELSEYPEQTALPGVKNKKNIGIHFVICTTTCKTRKA
jgi:ferredoxin